MLNKVVIMGAGGHAKVIADIIIKNGDIVYGFLDDNIPKGTVIAGITEFKVIGAIENCKEISEEKPELMFVIGIGDNIARKNMAEKYKLNYYTAIHPSAKIGLDVSIEDGTVVMSNACINVSTQIGKHSIINTGAIIEHDNVIRDYVHISPRGALGGTVMIGESTHIGIGATVKNNIKICNNCTIGAGAVVVKDIDEEGTYVGVPAKKVK